MIPIRIHPFFWLLAAVIGWLSSATLAGTAIWVAVIFVSVLVHEFGHALTARFFGQQATISLVGFGGVTMRSGPKLKLWQDFLITLNGPLAGFILFFLASFVQITFGKELGVVARYAVNVALYVNLFWTLVNLLPTHPLDGGRLLSILLEALIGFKAVKITLIFSIVFCGGAGLLFFAYGMMLPGAIFFLLAFENYRGWQAASTMAEEDQDSALWAELREGERQLQKGEEGVAREKFLAVKEKAAAGMVSTAATLHLAKLLVGEGQQEEAYQLLIPLRKRLSEEPLISLQLLAYQTGHYKEAISIGHDLYREQPLVAVAEVNALSHAILGEVQAALGWLECLVRAGSQNLGELLLRADFDPIRNDPQFQRWIVNAGFSL